MNPATEQRKLALIIPHDGTDTVGYRALSQLDQPLIIELRKGSPFAGVMEAQMKDLRKVLSHESASPAREVKQKGTTP